MGELTINGDGDKNNKKQEQQQHNSPHDTDASANKKRKRKEVAVFGNYRNYYGYRIDRGLEEDPRLKAMRKEWFEGKDCLDIGCNSGVVTISIAKKFSCRSILGIDIDGALIEDARWTLRKVMMMNGRKMCTELAKRGNGVKANGPEKNVIQMQSGLHAENSNCSNEMRNLFDVVSFEKGNFVQSWNPAKSTAYHAILCLSVAKWIHLNWGDSGLIDLFTKVWRLLQPGGVFILEPQPWVSYIKNRLVSQAASDNYQKIQIGPKDFQDILLDKVGFRMVENLSSGLSGTKIGFNRPILAFWK